jgi:putative ABC transport system permease protein
MLRLAWRNTRRNTRRTVLTAIAVTVAVTAITFMFAYITGIVGNLVDSYARSESGHVRIRKDGYTERERLMPVYLKVDGVTELLSAIRQHPDVEEAVPRIRSSVLVDGAGSNRPGLLLGLDMDREGPYLNPAGMAVNGNPPRTGHAEVMIGDEFAEKLSIGVGDTITVLGQTAYRSLGGLRLVVTDLASSGMSYLDNNMLVVPIDQAQLLADMPDASTEILVFAHNQELAQPLAVQLKEQLEAHVEGDIEVLSWLDQGPLMRTMQMLRPMLGVVMGLLLLMAGMVIINTMLMTVMERTQELGMQAALGMRRSDIVFLIVTEGLVIGLLGGVAGAILGSGVGIWLEHTGIDFTQAARTIDLPFQGMAYPDWRVSFPLIGLTCGVLAAGVAALYPALRAVKMAPAEALRQ